VRIHVYLQEHENPMPKKSEYIRVIIYNRRRG
jgi:hypothetical protein